MSLNTLPPGILFLRASVEAAVDASLKVLMSPGPSTFKNKADGRVQLVVRVLPSLFSGFSEIPVTGEGGAADGKFHPTGFPTPDGETVLLNTPDGVPDTGEFTSFGSEIFSILIPISSEKFQTS